MVLEKTLECLGLQGDQTVNPKGNLSWIFIGRTDAEAEAEAAIHWLPDMKNQLIGKDPDAGKDWMQEKGTEDEMVGWHHRLDGHEFEQAPGNGEGQGSLACCSLWGHKSLTRLIDWITTTDVTFWLANLPLNLSLLEISGMVPAFLTRCWLFHRDQFYL